ncbi:MAG: hypothetical protein WB919_16710 [Candidatus Sulfotelmatobacter sp.]
MPETGSWLHGHPGELVATVSVADLKSVWDMFQDLGSQHPGGVAVEDGLIERVCSPKADIHAVVYLSQDRLPVHNSATCSLVRISIA